MPGLLPPAVSGAGLSCAGIPCTVVAYLRELAYTSLCAIPLEPIVNVIGNSEIDIRQASVSA